MRSQNRAAGLLVLGLTALFILACDDGDTPRDDAGILPSVEYRDRVILILDNEAHGVTLIEASEDRSVAFGARDEELILQGSEQVGPSYWHFIAASDGGDELLMGTEAFNVRYSDEDGDGMGTLQLLDATEASFATRENVVLDAEEVLATPGRDIRAVVDALEATEDDLRSGRWRMLADEAESLLNATEALPDGLIVEIEPLLIEGIESVQVIREGLLLADEDLSSGGQRTGPNVFRVPEEEDEFLASVEAARLLDSDARDAFRDTVAGIARELLLLAANEAVPGNFLPATLLMLDGTEVTFEPTPSKLFTAAKQVSVGAKHTCAIDLDDELFCWGLNDAGQLGNGQRLPETSPRYLGASAYTLIALGTDSSCAVESLSEARGLCWGDNGAGQLAVDNATESVATPTLIDETALRSIDTGGVHTCSVSAIGALFCWGDNGDGQLGVPAVTDETFTPTQVGSATNWDVVSTGAIHTCAINDAAELFCWGFNTDGRAGLGDTPQGDVPTQVGVDTWKQVSAGGAFTCGINTVDELYCWGANGFGQLGVGSEFPSTTPTRVGTDTWNSVDTGFLHGCAIRSDDALFCWGSNFGGRLGLGDTAQRNNPTQVGTQEWAFLSVGTDHGCAIRTDDSSVWCWGANDSGQLGNGDTVPSLEPVRVVE